MANQPGIQGQPSGGKRPGRLLQLLLNVLALLVFLWAFLRRWFNRRSGRKVGLAGRLDQAVSTPTPTRHRLALAAAGAPLADPTRLPVMLEALRNLLATRRATVRFSNHTGLVRRLRGDLYPEQSGTNPDDLREIAGTFLKKYGAALHGAPQGYAYTAIEPSVPGRVVLRQTDRGGIPVYSGNMVFGFSNAGRLGIIFNGWYPLDPNRNHASSVKFSWKSAGSRAVGYVQERFDYSGPLHVTQGDALKGGLVIFPRGNEGRNGGDTTYRPAWIVLVNAEGGVQGWRIVVDAETGEILDVESAIAAAWTTDVYVNNTLANKNTRTPQDLDIGANVPLVSAPNFALGGPQFYEPSPLSDIGFRSANLYYHLRIALRTFQSIATQAWPVGLPAGLAMPGANSPMPVTMETDLPSIAQFNWTSNSLQFGKGGNLGSKPYAIGDPTLDSQVIYHEYTHGVLSVFLPDIYLLGRFKEAINEGTAFYFGCTVAERQDQAADPSHWGTIAFKDFDDWRILKHEGNQAAGFDYLPMYNVFPRYATLDPAGEEYGCGMVWARALWDVRRLLGDAIADPIVLHGLSLEGGAQTEMETPAEAIIHVDGQYSQGGPAHENAMQLVFCSRGIMADAPIHALRSVKVAGTAYVIAAVENAGAGDQTCSCMFSTETAGPWTPLGTSTPSAIVALTTATVNDTPVLWAAEETWDEVTRKVNSVVYRYELTSSNNFAASNAWQNLGTLSDSVLSLAATWDAVGNRCLLFAGTESGLYKYDGAWSSPVLTGEPVYSLAIQTNPACLVAGTRNGLRLFDLSTLTVFHDVGLETDVPSGSELVLCIVPDSDGQGYLWAGTAFHGIFSYDPTQRRWARDKYFANTQTSPVYDILPDHSNPGWILYAGTNDGVWQKNGTWKSINTTVSTVGEQITGTAATALCRTDHHIFAATAQRGIWRYDFAAWDLFMAGLPRIGRQVDAIASVGTQTFTPRLPSGGVATYVVYVPQPLQSLSFAVDIVTARLALYYVPPQIDSQHCTGAGLTNVPLVNGKIANPAVGFYVLTVTSTGNQALDYTVSLTGA